MNFWSSVNTENAGRLSQLPMRATTRPIGIDLFAGAGGMSLGFEQSGFDIVASVDYDPIHCATHEFNFPSCATICRSVTEINGEYIRDTAGIGKRDIDVVFGGAPCQGFSLIGKRALDDPRNALVHHFVRLVSELKPKYFVFENVRGLTIGEHKRFLEEIMQAFRSAGYKVEENYRVLNAADYGVPQDRRRLFLMGARKGYGLPEYPKPTHVRPDGEQMLTFIRKTPTVMEAIGDLPEAEDFEILLERDWVYTSFGKPSKYASSLRRLNEKQNGLELLSSSLRTIHTELSKRRFKETKPGAVEPISRFLKLDPNGISNTLRAGTATDRGAFTSPRPIHPYSPRCITVREAARLHSYPDWFRFHVTKWHGFRQIGNSVPPFLARAVASKVIEKLGAPILKTERIRRSDVDLLELDMSGAALKYGVESTVIPARTRKVYHAHA
jgi:DNA (cytosine-5)-methyltransferase 1